jgi:alpha-L-rhamnosidase
MRGTCPLAISLYHLISLRVYNSPLAANNLRVEYLPSSSSIAIDNPVPRFSWQISHTDRSQTQSAYQLIVTLSSISSHTRSLTYARVMKRLRMHYIGGKTVWDSGKVKSSQNVLVSYGGSTLIGQSVYQWQVTWWDAQGVAAAASSLAIFEVAILDDSVWTTSGSKWIASGNDEGNIYRRDFYINNTGTGASITRARAYVCGLGWHEFHVNGQRVGMDMLSTGWTRWQRTVLYNTYDITPLLIPNQINTLGMMLGWGWRDTRSFPNLNHDTPEGDDRER